MTKYKLLGQISRGIPGSKRLNSSVVRLVGENCLVGFHLYCSHSERNAFYCHFFSVPFCEGNYDIHLGYGGRFILEEWVMMVYPDGPQFSIEQLEMYFEAAFPSGPLEFSSATEVGDFLRADNPQIRLSGSPVGPCFAYLEDRNYEAFFDLYDQYLVTLSQSRLELYRSDEEIKSLFNRYEHSMQESTDCLHLASWMLKSGREKDLDEFLSARTQFTKTHLREAMVLISWKPRWGVSDYRAVEDYQPFEACQPRSKYSGEKNERAN